MRIIGTGPIDKLEMAAMEQIWGRSIIKNTLYTVVVVELRDPTLNTEAGLDCLIVFGCFGN